MKFFVIFPILIILLGFSLADAQYIGNIEYYHLPIIVESNQYSILAQSIIGKFTGVLYDTQADSLIFSIHGSTNSIDSASITMNKQTFLELLFTDYAKTPDSMLVLINGVEQPYKTVEDDEIISWRFHVPSDSSEIEIIPSTPMFSTGTYSNEDIPFGPPMIYPPLKQNHVGIVAENIQCRENLVLVQKYDGSPACVKAVTKQKLIERGWVMYDGDISTFDYVIKKNNVTYGSQYQIIGGIVDEIIYDENSNSLVILLSKSDGGYFQVVIQTGVLHQPRQLPFAYTVLIDGKEIEFEQFSPILLKIPFEKGVNQIEITGLD